MKHIVYTLGLAAALGGCASASPPGSCAIPGELLHWQADYCLFKAGTDDIIAVAPCLEVESKKMLFRSSCNGKVHYKRALCELSIDAGGRLGPVDNCVKDPVFIGPTVRNGGA